MSINKSIAIANLIFACAITTFFTGCTSTDSNAVPVIYGQQIPFSGKVFYSKDDIPEGQAVRASDFEVRDLEESRAPIDALGDPRLIEGAKAVFGIPAGVLICAHHLTGKNLTESSGGATQNASSSEATSITLVIATHPIAAGSTIGADDLRAVKIPVSRVPVDGLESITVAIGMKASHPIEENEVVSQHALMSEGESQK